MTDNKTIYALSTVMGKSGVAVVRISGSKAFTVFDVLTKMPAQNIISRKMYLLQLRRRRSFGSLFAGWFSCTKFLYR